MPNRILLLLTVLLPAVAQTFEVASIKPTPPNLGPRNPAAKESEGPSIFTALEEQLGLKLEAAKAPLDILVVTQISKPSAN